MRVSGRSHTRSVSNEFGIDFAGSDPSEEALKKDGVKFVARYVSTPGNFKNLRSDEAKHLHDEGIAIVVVFETVANESLNGHAAGVRDAQSANEQARACGLPPLVPIYFAVDFDPSQSPIETILDYFRGVASVLGPHGCGVYGGYEIVKAVLDARICRYAWQTYAWSGGKWDPRAQIQQYQNAETFDGVGVDYDRAVAADFGAWMPATPKPKPEPKPAPKPKPLPRWRRAMAKAKPLWAWIIWRDHGAIKSLRPKSLPVRIPLAWWKRYILHRGKKS